MSLLHRILPVIAQTVFEGHYGFRFLTRLHLNLDCCFTRARNCPSFPYCARRPITTITTNNITEYKSTSRRHTLPQQKKKFSTKHMVHCVQKSTYYTIYITLFIPTCHHIYVHVVVLDPLLSSVLPTWFQVILKSSDIQCYIT